MNKNASFHNKLRDRKLKSRENCAEMKMNVKQKTRIIHFYLSVVVYRWSLLLMSSLYFFLTSPSLSMVIKVMLIPYLYQYSSYYVLYIYFVYLSSVNLRWKMWFFAVGLQPRGRRTPRELRKWVQNQIFQSELLCSRFVSYIIQYYTWYCEQSHLYTHCYILFSLLHTLQNEYCDARFIYCILSKYLDKFQIRGKRKVDINVRRYIDVNFYLVQI